MKKVTSVTTFKTEVGNVIALTYSEIDEKGNILKRNAKIQKVVVDAKIDKAIATLTDYAQSIVDGGIE